MPALVQFGTCIVTKGPIVPLEFLHFIKMESVHLRRTVMYSYSVVNLFPNCLPTRKKAYKILITGPTLCDSPHKGPVMWKTFPSHGIIMSYLIIVSCDVSNWLWREVAAYSPKFKKVADGCMRNQKILWWFQKTDHLILMSLPLIPQYILHHCDLRLSFRKMRLKEILIHSELVSTNIASLLAGILYTNNLFVLHQSTCFG